MANHIENYITIRNADEVVLNEIKRIFEYEAENSYKTIHTEELVSRVYGEETPVEYDREWYCEKTGAKWMYGVVEDWDIENITLSITSAWDPINEWLERLSINLIALKADVVIENKFEDEGLNFIGVGYFSKEYSDVEYFDDDIDAEKFWQDDEYRYEIYEATEVMMDDERRTHLEVIEDLKNEQYEK
jgi:hypothetical protein